MSTPSETGRQGDDDPPRCDVFLSYRHEDNQILAESLSRHLSEALPRRRVFIDLDMDLGSPFEEVVMSHLRGAAVVLALVGPLWNCDRRLWSDTDWPRRELEVAHTMSKCIIPVLHSGAAMPMPDEVPQSLGFVLGCNAITLGTRYFDLRAVADRLAELVNRRLDLVRLRAVKSSDNGRYLGFGRGRQTLVFRGKSGTA